MFDVELGIIFVHQLDFFRGRKINILWNLNKNTTRKQCIKNKEKEKKKNTKSRILLINLKLLLSLLLNILYFTHLLILVVFIKKIIKN